MELEVMLGGQAIGKARVDREGLYWVFRCRCRLSGEVVYKLQVRCGDQVAHLGIPVPQNGAFELNTRIPTKKLGSGQMRIEAVPKGVPLDGKFVPLRADEPFHYLQQLEKAYLQVREGQVGIILTAI